MSISASFNLSAAAESAISVILSKESHVVACASDGVPKQGEIANAATDISVYKGDILLSVGTDWHIDALEASGATFTHTNDTCSLSAFNEGSLSGYVDITIKIGTVSIVRRFTVSKITDAPMYFTTGAAWSAAASYKYGQYLLLDGIIYVWSYSVSGNSTVNPKDDIINNPVMTHWKSYENWTLLATEIILANFGKLASAIFSGEYMYSQYGKTGAGVAKEAEGDYAAFNKDFSATSPFIPNFSIDLLTGLLRASNVDIQGKINATNSEFSGNLKGVTGSFKRLNCVDEQGNAVGSIAFDVTGKLWFEGDMQHQGFDYVNNRSYRFLTSNVWCRGSFGSQSLNTLVVWGNYGYYYVDGLSDTHNKKVFYAFSSYNFDGDTYYDIPLYVTTGDASGFPVDLIIFRNTTDGRYKLTAQSGKKVRVINGNDDFNGVWLYHNGGLDQCGGGTTYDMIYCGDKLSPAVSTRPGAGWILGAWRDNNW